MYSWQKLAFLICLISNLTSEYIVVWRRSVRVYHVIELFHHGVQTAAERLYNTIDWKFMLVDKWTSGKIGKIESIGPRMDPSKMINRWTVDIQLLLPNKSRIRVGLQEGAQVESKYMSTARSTWVRVGVRHFGTRVYGLYRVAKLRDSSSSSGLG